MPRVSYDLKAENILIICKNANLLGKSKNENGSQGNNT